MGADLRALLDDADGDLTLGRRGELLQTDGGGKARGPAPDDDHVVFHLLARHTLFAHPASADRSDRTIEDCGENGAID